MWGGSRHRQAARQLFQEKSVHALEHGLQDRECPVAPWSPAGTGHWSSAPSAPPGKPSDSHGCHSEARAQLSPCEGRAQPPPGAVPVPAPRLSSACLPAIPIPVVHLHLDGPARQRARDGKDLPQHLRGLNTALPVLLGQKGTPGHPLGSSCPRWTQAGHPKRQRNSLEAFWRRSSG